MPTHRLSPSCGHRVLRQNALDVPPFPCQPPGRMGQSFIGRPMMKKLEVCRASDNVYTLFCLFDVGVMIFYASSEVL